MPRAPVLLMFRKPNKTTINKFLSVNVLSILVYIEIFQGFSSEKNRLYLDISRSFKCLKSSPVVCLICYYLRLVVFVLREYILKVHILVSSEHKLCQTWNTCLVSCIYWSIASLNKLLIFFNTAYYQESYIKIIEYSKFSMVTVAEWLDGSFESLSWL